MERRKKLNLITESELLQILLQKEYVKGFKPFTFVVLITEPKMNKTDNPYFGKVKKFSARNYYMSCYKERVESNAGKEGIDIDYKVEKQKGKTHVSDFVSIDDKTQSIYYLSLEVFEQVKGRTRYYCGDETISVETISQWLPKPAECEKQPQEKKVLWITPKISNIHRITLDGITYEVVR